jgi:hypothetical protein
MLSLTLRRSFGYISVLVYFVIVGSVRLHQIQKYPYSKNVPRTGIHIYELLSSAFLLFILFVISIVQFANSELTFSSGLAKLMTGATWVRIHFNTSNSLAFLSNISNRCTACICSKWSTVAV